MSSASATASTPAMAMASTKDPYIGCDSTSMKNNEIRRNIRKQYNAVQSIRPLGTTRHYCVGVKGIIRARQEDHSAYSGRTDTRGSPPCGRTPEQPSAHGKFAGHIGLHSASCLTNMTERDR